MPLIYYLCSKGHGVSKFFRQAKDAPAVLACECQEEAKKQLKPPSSVSKIIVDNGFQARAVEVNPDIVEINKERSQKDYREE
jgi:tetraacyldisaccharide-1-P 4'-kinase